MINKYYIWGVVILVICILLFFFFSPPFSLYKNIDTNIFANYGNFIAGLLGSMIALFAAILFYKALKSPTKEGAVGSPSATSTINPDLPSQEEIIETTPQPAGDVLPDINPA